MDGGRANDAELLWETGADQGSGAAALRLAKLYDPNSFRPGGPVPRPDPRLAAKYYKQADEAGEASSASPRAALRQSLEDKRQRGDQDARIILQEFWP
jgi:TPR repeat protein